MGISNYIRDLYYGVDYFNPVKKAEVKIEKREDRSEKLSENDRSNLRKLMLEISLIDTKINCEKNVYDKFVSNGNSAAACKVRIKLHNLEGDKEQAKRNLKNLENTIIEQFRFRFKDEDKFMLHYLSDNFSIVYSVLVQP